jgi:hypothetical protein
MGQVTCVAAWNAEEREPLSAMFSRSKSRVGSCANPEASRPPPQSSLQRTSCEKVANRNTMVWHGATENGPFER